MQVQRNKAIVGQNAFAHEAGIHQDGMLKERSTYEIMKPEDVGIPRTELVLGKHSGRHALKQRVADLGYHLTDEQLNQRLRGVQAAGRPQEGDLRRGHRGAGREPAAGRHGQPVDAGRLHEHGRHRLADLRGGDAQAPGRHGPPRRGRRQRADRRALQGDQPDHRRAGEGGRLPRAVGDARTWTHWARRTIEIEHGGQRSRARAVSLDVVEASALAYLEVVNRVASRQVRDRLKPTDNVPTEVVPAT